MAQAKAGPREAQLRAMRERRHEERQKRSTVLAKLEAKAAKVAKAKALVVSQPALANAVANTNSPTYQSRDADTRRAYQRDLMRKRRAAAKAT